MKNMLNNSLNFSGLTSILFAMIGLILTIFPKLSLSIISYSIALIFIVTGIQSLITDKTKFYFSLGFILLTWGIAILLIPNLLTSFILIILGIWFIGNGIWKLKFSIDIKNTNNVVCLTSLMIAMLNILCGITLILKPSNSAFTITSLVGIILIIYSISNLIDILIIKKNIKQIINLHK